MNVTFPNCIIFGKNFLFIKFSMFCFANQYIPWLYGPIKLHYFVNIGETPMSDHLFQGLF